MPPGTSTYVVIASSFRADSLCPPRWDADDHCGRHDLFLGRRVILVVIVRHASRRRGWRTCSADAGGWVDVAAPPLGEGQHLDRRACSLLRISRYWSRVAQLLIPVRGAPLASEVEQVPDRLDRANMTGSLFRVGRGIEELRPPEVADGSAVAMEHVQHGPLVSLGGLGQVVAVVG